MQMACVCLVPSQGCQTQCSLVLVAGSGFCILNDAAVASEVLLREGLVRRILILDLDVHQASTQVLATRCLSCSSSCQ